MCQMNKASSKQLSSRLSEGSVDGLTDEYLAVVPNNLKKHITLSSEVYPRCVSRKLKVINSKDKILKKDFINFFCNCGL
jgi:hypothetical protein